MAWWRWGRGRDPGTYAPAGGTEGGVTPAQRVTGSGNASATHGGIAVTGIYHAHSGVVLPPEAVRPVSEVKARPGLDNLPYRTTRFVGRTAELDRLDAAMKRNGGVGLHAVHGLGGVGKSTLVAHWAATRARKHRLAPVRWMSADSAAGVERGLAALATALQPAVSKALTVEALAENGMQWLATHSGWLLVLDNVNHVADIAPLLARLPHGRFLVTSRLATVWHDAGEVIRLDVLRPDESLALLTRIATVGGGRDLSGAAELCADLGHLPLAVEQAAAYLAQNPLLTPGTYLGLLRRNPGPLYQRGGEGFTVHERTIARIWRVTLDDIRERRPQAADMLRTLAWYAPDGIPAGLLDDEDAPAGVADAIGVLNAYSMITVDPTARALSVHRLVQSVARTSDTDDPHRASGLITEARGRATAALEAVVRPTDWQDPATWPTGRTLLPHMDALADHTPPSADTGTTARLLDHTGVFLISQGLAAQAAEHLRRSLAHHERELGHDDIHTLACRHNLAHAHDAAGHVKRAIPLYERALRDEERVLGATHRLTLASRNNLADAYRAAGDEDKALALLGDVSASAYGSFPDSSEDGEDLSALTARNTLARTWQKAGRHDEAVRLYEENLDACVRAFGEDHHLTLVTRNNLTAARTASEDPRETVRLFEGILGDMERVLGEEHPDTLLARGNLAGAYREAGEPGRAVALFDEVLPVMERVLGEDHGTTRAARVALALACRAAGDPDRALRLAAPRPEPSAGGGTPAAFRPDPTGPGGTATGDEGHPDTRGADIGYGLLAVGDADRAVPLFERAVRDRRLDGDDPGSLTVRHNLAVAHLMAGAPERALPLFEEVLRVRERSLGEDHPDTLTSLRHLADTHREAGDFDRAVPLYERTFRARSRVLGAHHEDTLAVLGMLAYTHRLAGRPDRAAPLFEQALHGQEQAHGPHHPETFALRNNLAETYRDAGDLPRAVLLHEENAAACARALGDDHAHTLVTRHNLAVVQASSGDFGRALPLLGDTFERQRTFLGEDHPDTLATQLSLAGMCQAVGLRRRARRLYKRTFLMCRRALGEDHPLTRQARERLMSAKRAGRGR